MWSLAYSFTRKKKKILSDVGYNQLESLENKNFDTLSMTSLKNLSIRVIQKLDYMNYTYRAND